MKRRRVGPDRSRLAVLLRLFLFSSLEYILPGVHLEGSFCTVLPRGEVNGHGVYMSSVDLFLSGFFLDYLRQTTLLHSSSLVSPGKD